MLDVLDIINNTGYVSQIYIHLFEKIKLNFTKIKFLERTKSLVETDFPLANHLEICYSTLTHRITHDHRFIIEFEPKRRDP